VNEDELYRWSKYWRDAATALAATQVDKIAAAQAHLDRMRELNKWTKEFHEAHRISTYSYWATEYYVADAELLLSQAKKH
jgi:hypothetical protein